MRLPHSFTLNLRHDTEGAEQQLFQALLPIAEKHHELHYLVNKDGFYEVTVDLGNQPAGQTQIDMINDLLPKAIRTTAVKQYAFLLHGNIPFIQLLEKEIRASGPEAEQLPRLNNLLSSFRRFTAHRERLLYQHKFISAVARRMRPSVSSHSPHDAAARFFAEDDEDIFGFAGAAAAPPSRADHYAVSRSNIRDIIGAVREKLNPRRLGYSDSFEDDRSSRIRIAAPAHEHGAIAVTTDENIHPEVEIVRLRIQLNRPMLARIYGQHIERNRSDFQDPHDAIAREFRQQDMTRLVKALIEYPSIGRGYAIRYPSVHSLQAGSASEIELHISDRENFNAEAFSEFVRNKLNEMALAEDYACNQIAAPNLDAQLLFRISLKDGKTADETTCRQYTQTMMSRLEGYNIIHGYCKSMSAVSAKDRSHIYLILTGISPSDTESTRCLLKLISRELTRSCGAETYTVSGLEVRRGDGNPFNYREHTLTILDRHKELTKKGLRDDQVPQLYRCALTGKIMDEPGFIVHAPNVYYDKKALVLHFFSQQAPTCPRTGRAVNPMTDLRIDDEFTNRLMRYFDITMHPEKYDLCRLNLINLTPAQHAYFVALAAAVGNGREKALIITSNSSRGPTPYSVSINCFWLESQLTREKTAEMARESGCGLIQRFGL